MHKGTIIAFTVIDRNEQTRFELRRAEKAYHTGTAFPTEIS
jgi:hypothetical protein